MFRQYKMHVYNIINQFEHFGRIRKELIRNEAIIHVDFAQNYVAKMGKEVQSVHFGALKNQITLHTGTCTAFSDSNLDIAPFCGVSDSLTFTATRYLPPYTPHVGPLDPVTFKEATLFTCIRVH